MVDRRVALLCSEHLLGESLERMLGSTEGIELVGHWPANEASLAVLAAKPPDIILLADEEIDTENISRFTARLLDGLPDVPLVRVRLVQNVVRIYSTQRLPARSVDLIDAIRQLPLGPRREPDGADLNSTGGGRDANEKAF